MNKIARKFKPAARQPDDMAVHEPSMFKASDAMHALLVGRADTLMGCTEGSPEEQELACLTDAIETYEALRWPKGKDSGRQGLNSRHAIRYHHRGGEWIVASARVWPVLYNAPFTRAGRAANSLRCTIQGG